MSELKPFDLLNSPLEGVNLIEASAGTGKTYTISGLFLRLVLERGLDVPQILVVTFTEAATAELRDRIRQRLRAALEVFQRGRGEDIFLQALVERNRAGSRPVGILKEALRDFDKAAIFTIHGFCKRMLQENAFEIGNLFDKELLTDQEELKRDIVEDFWRRNFYDASPLFVEYALANRFNPNNLLKSLAHWVTLPYLKILPRIDVPDTSAVEKDYCRTFDELCAMWSKAGGEVLNLLLHHKDLNRNKYGKGKIAVWADLMDAWLGAGPNPVPFRGFEKFTAGELERGLRKGGSAPVHAFFRACENLKEQSVALESLFQERLLALQGGLFSFVREELGRRKHERNVQSFDDLLTDFDRALKGDGGERLSMLLGLKFKAALIDEFQDTDPVQYAVFNKVFGKAKNGLFLIGDPKQAVYGFRGADIFTYMRASEDATLRYTLGENWRSEPDLIQAVNTVFENSERAFVFEGIPFDPVTPAENRNPDFLEMDGRQEPPFQLWFLDARKIEGPGKAISKAKARELIPRAVAGEIARLVRLGREKRALIGKRSLTAGDIAVLVRKNSEAVLMKKALSSLHIPSVLHAGGNLFDSPEAMELERVLAAAAQPERGRLLRAALATDLLGVTGENLESMETGDGVWEMWLVKFRDYHDIWKDRGFIRMFRFLLSRERVMSRLMSYENGERRNTNLLHLGEVLHRQSMEKKVNMTGLLKWLSEQRDDARPGRVVHPLRLESDENAVRLVTIHKSKGLEYPLVFCPFLWDGSTVGKGEKSFVFHDRREDNRLVLDLGSEDFVRNRISAEEEILAENLRLLYVALTRARCRCYLVWGRLRETETSAPAYLLYPPESFRGSDLVGAAREHFKGLDDDALVKGLEELAGKANGTISVTDMPEEDGGAKPSPVQGGQMLDNRTFSGVVQRNWGVCSFSSLTSGRLYDEGWTADRDFNNPGESENREKKWVEAGAQPPLDIFSFPGGTKAGIFFHDILEHLDFRSKGPDHMEPLISEKLRTYGFEEQWKPAVCAMMARVLSAPLDPGTRDLRLSAVGNRDRLNELEFYFPLKALSPGSLHDLFDEAGEWGLPETFPETIGRLDFSPTRGFMRGYIDLVFLYGSRWYLADWKSNILGQDLKDYGPGGMALSMEEGVYTLQYLLYTLALDQYLKLRMPGYDYEKHFGGVFYIFIRGVDPERDPECGIYRARPPAKLIHALGDKLIDMKR